MATSSIEVLQALEHFLGRLSTESFPHVPTPPNCKKRASVAIILRVRPAISTTPSASLVDLCNASKSSAVSLAEFFAQPWVQSGEPEVLLIKRAGRAGDRWSDHVALPGGKRDPEDESDLATAIRETREEVGLDLSGPNCLQTGNLPQRVVTTTWERKALMVLCPYIFVLTDRTWMPVQPRPAEVAAAHWVPLGSLLSPNMWTREYVDSASRMAKQVGPIARAAMRFLVGRMVFSAVQLLPSESIYATPVYPLIPDRPESRLCELALASLPFPAESARHKLPAQKPLLLWGLTLGVLVDLLDQLPPHNAVSLWRYPTFTPLDLRFIVWLFTRRLRNINAEEVSSKMWSLPCPNAVAVTETELAQLAPAAGMKHHNKVGIGNLDARDAVGALLTGYYDRVNMAIGVFVAYRLAVASSLGYWILKVWRPRRA